MKIISFEPTPSPNVMKLNLLQSLADGVSFECSTKQMLTDDAPELLRHLFNIPGVKGLYATGSFIALERQNEADWREILALVPGISDEQLHVEIDRTPSSAVSFDGQSEHPFEVDVQTIADIPMQVKLRSLQAEFRYPMPDSFVRAAIEAGKKMGNLIRDRVWENRGIRYGIAPELGALIVEEEAARAKGLIHHSTEQSEIELTLAEQLDERFVADWRDRYARFAKLEIKFDHLIYFVQALRDPHPSIRRLAVVFMGELKDNAVFSYLFMALADRAVSVRRTAGDTLSDLGDPVAIPHMINALSDESKLVRWRAARYLYEVGDETAISALQIALADTEFEVSLQARMALDRIHSGKTAEGTMWQQITNRSKNVQ